MEIIIENCSSPGASFTSHTNEIILKYYEWINENLDKVDSYRTFRKELVEHKGINDNNGRNINPFLKNSGFIKYEANADLIYSEFFTPLGQAYCKTLESINMLQELDDSEAIKKSSEIKFEEILRQIIVAGLTNLLSVPGCKYVPEYIASINYLLLYKKIDRAEFAYLLYCKGNGDDNYLESMKENVEMYRSKEIIIKFKVSVRNDNKIIEKTGEARRLEGPSFLTAINYILKTLEQAGIVKKNKTYYHLIEEKRNVAETLIGDINQ